MKGIAEKRQHEIEEVKSKGVAEVAWHFEMEATDAYLATLFKEGGVSDYVEGVNENRIMADSEARQRCEEFARMFLDLKSFTRVALVVQQDIEAKTRVQGVKMVSGVEEFLYSSDPQREGSEGESQGDAGG